MNRIKGISIFLSAGILAGCATAIPPQSVEELREEVRSGVSRIEVEEYVVKRPFEHSYNAVQTNAERCFEITVSELRNDESEPRPEAMRYRSESLMTSETTGETFLQLDRRDNSKMPDGGYFVLLADLEAMSLRETRLTVYKAMSGYDNINQSIVAWAEGANDECPRFPKGALDGTITYHNP